MAGTEKKIICTTCQPRDVEPVITTTAADAPAPLNGVGAVDPDGVSTPPPPTLIVEPLITDGEAGSSARREGDRRREKRERETLSRHPRLGKLIWLSATNPRASAPGEREQ